MCENDKNLELFQKTLLTTANFVLKYFYRKLFLYTIHNMFYVQRRELRRENVVLQKCKNRKFICIFQHFSTEFKARHFRNQEQIVIIQNVCIFSSLPLFNMHRYMYVHIE